jgi:purine-binding chemotaxis protein CheW
MNPLSKAQPGRFLMFQLQGEEFATPIGCVREINQMVEITPVPKYPAFVKGVINLRGKLIPLIDLRLKFDMPEASYNRETCIIIIETPHGDMGNIVDGVKEVVELSEQDIEPSPYFGTSGYHTFVIGLGKKDKKVLVLVDILKSFEPAHLKQVQNLPAVVEDSIKKAG